MSTANAGLRDEVEAAMLEAVERIGTRFQRDAIVARFLKRGASRATLYRWIAGVLASGRPGQHLASKMHEAAVERSARVADPAADAAREAIAKLPAVVRVEDIASTGTIPVIERLNECIRAADRVIKYSQGLDGGVRNAKLMLSASEHLRRSLETSVRLYEAMRSVNQVDAFHGAVIEEIGKESPELAERVLRRLSILSTQWAP